MSVFISLIMDVLDITLTLGTTVITLGSILYGVIVFGIGIWFFKNLLGSNHSPIDIGLSSDYYDHFDFYGSSLDGHEPFDAGEKAYQEDIVPSVSLPSWADWDKE